MIHLQIIQILPKAFDIIFLFCISDIVLVLAYDRSKKADTIVIQCNERDGQMYNFIEKQKNLEDRTHYS